MTKIKFACYCDPSLITQLYVTKSYSYMDSSQYQTEIPVNTITELDVDISGNGFRNDGGGIAFKLRSDIPLAMAHIFKKADANETYVVNSVIDSNKKVAKDDFSTCITQGSWGYALRKNWTGVTSFYYIWLVPVMGGSKTDGYKLNNHILTDPTQDSVNEITNNSRPKDPVKYPFTQTLNNVTSSVKDNYLKDYSNQLFQSKDYNELTDGFLFGYKPDNVDEIKNSMIVKYTPVKGYGFKENATLEFNTGFYGYEKISFKPTDENNLIADLRYSNLVKLHPSFQKSYYNSFNDTGIEVTADKVDTPVPTEKTAFTALFRVNNELLNSISEKRFIYGNTNNPQTLDLGNYILKLFKVPFNIPDNYINETQPIKLGFKDIGLNADQLINSAYHVEIGTISVPEIYKNVYDYSSTECTLFLPFVNEITLNAQTVIGHDLKISYDIDLYTGKTTILIYLDDTKELVYQNQIEISKDIPYYLVSNNAVKGTTETTYLNNTLQAYLIVLRDDPKTGTIKNFTGFNNFNNVELNTNASLSEQNEIISQLQSGVYINE